MMLKEETPEFLRNFIIYMETICGKSPKTVSEYYLDIRTFLRFLKIERGMTAEDTPAAQIAIDDITPEMLSCVTLSELYSFMDYLANKRPVFHKSASTPYGDKASTRARKISALRALYKYMTTKAQYFTENPVMKLDIPKIPKTLPKYLSLEDSMKLLSSIGGENRERDYCIFALFLNCGLRVSELTAINLQDIQGDTLKIHGKGSKERTVRLNEAAMRALQDYMPHRVPPLNQHKDALFVSKRRQRMSVQTVKWVVKHHITASGLDPHMYSAHKLRHTAATLMYQNGVDVRTLKDVLGHKSLDTTMIYTHLCDQNLKDASEMNPLANFIPVQSGKTN